MRASLFFAALLAGTLLSPPVAAAKGGGANGSYSTGTHGHRAAASVARDSHGRMERSTHAKNKFKKCHPCPSTGKSFGSCPGYVIDHVMPLKHGGADAPFNMQWQTTEEARAKDRWE